MPQAAAPSCFLGLISGTSVDGIDAALVSFEPRPQVHFAHTFAYPAPLRAMVLELSQAQARVSPDDLARLDTELGIAFAEAAVSAITRSQVPTSRIAAIGSHGQTLRHNPADALPYTLQLGDPNQIVERCGITTVADFRRRDVAAGGQGAPLMPAFHHALLSDAAEVRSVLNLGGIANLTLLPRSGGVRGFDTGPANGLMDAWCALHLRLPFDRDGALAVQGRVDDALLTALHADPWFALPPPKSTGRDQFHLDWLRAAMGARTLAIADVQATLCELTAITVAQALLAHAADTRRLLICGGGVHNPVLLQRLARHLPGIAVASTATLGLDPDFVEAAGFAWLARETLAGRAGNRAEVTGARGPRVLGAIYPA
ncbi:MAG: anhydro-N-acetylmuramic acid kinase [Xanthomonadaceae bacterium]|nr:anhydro-N-acetylmuramic acid kinase [Xanthomonadaceae bacterium]